MMEVCRRVCKGDGESAGTGQPCSGRVAVSTPYNDRVEVALDPRVNEMSGDGRFRLVIRRDDIWGCIHNTKQRRNFVRESHEKHGTGTMGGIALGGPGRTFFRGRDRIFLVQNVVPHQCRLRPNRRRLPPNRRRLPSNRRRFPSNRRRFPSNHCWLLCNRCLIVPLNNELVTARFFFQLKNVLGSSGLL